MSLKTRFADKEDLPDVYVLYLAGLREIKEPHDESDSLEYVLRCWTKAPCILLIDNGIIIGFAGLNLYIPENDKKSVYLRDYHFYIQPSHRGILAWRTLCKAVQECADQFQLPFLGEHRLQGTIEHHERLIRMAGAKPFAILATYGVKE